MSDPATVAANTLKATNTLVKGLPATQQPGTSFWDTFWSKVYSFDLPSKAADNVIAFGADVKETRDAVVKDVKTGVSLGLTYGPLILIAAVALYFYAVFSPRR